MKTKKLKDGGNCYEAAAQVAVLSPPDDREYFVVHGLVGGFIIEGEYVPLHGHAWVEYCEKVPMPAEMHKNLPEGHPDYFEMWFCIDKSNNNDSTLPREVYYHYGGVREDETVRYTVEEARLRMVDAANFGPWEDFILETEKKEGL